MAICLASPLMLCREFLAILPSDAEVFAEEVQCGDVYVRLNTCGCTAGFLVSKADRVLSLNGIRDLYQSSVTRILHEMWAGAPKSVDGEVIQLSKNSRAAYASARGANG